MGFSFNLAPSSSQTQTQTRAAPKKESKNVLPFDSVEPGKEDAKQTIFSISNGEIEIDPLQKTKGVKRPVIECTNRLDGRPRTKRKTPSVSLTEPANGLTVPKSDTPLTLLSEDDKTAGELILRELDAECGPRAVKPILSRNSCVADLRKKCRG
eukprot:Selendium_serpulae@DN4519_c0_g1_i1.p1